MDLRDLYYAEIVRVTELVEEASGKRKVSGILREELFLSVKYILSQGLSSALSGGSRVSTIHLSNRWFLKTNPLNAHGFSYRIFVQRAFKILVDLDVIRIVRRGFYDRPTSRGELTKFSVTEEYLCDLTTTLKCNEFTPEDLLVSDAFYSPEPLIRVSLKTKNQARQWVCVDTDVTNACQQKEFCLERINKTLSRSWVDLDLNEQEWAALELKLGKPVNFSRRFLYRVYNDPKLITNGRFVGPWWQTIPSELRSRITINGKRTVEIDFSAMHPRILYALEGIDLKFDPYSVVSSRGRGEVKQAFNAMINSSSDLSRPPRGLDLKTVGCSWPELKEEILRKHPAIKHRFFTGFGLKLMGLESDIAEGILMKLSSKNIVCIPVHDSFIVHHGNTSLLRESMRETFAEKFGVDPGLSTEYGIASNSDSVANDMGFEEELVALVSFMALPQEKRLRAFESRIYRG